VPSPGRRGRPRKYGEKTWLQSLFAQPDEMQKAISPVYGEGQGKHKVTIRYRVRDLLWKPAGVVVRFVAVCHPIRGNIILMSTDMNLGALEIIQLYALRFKIEYAFIGRLVKAIDIRCWTWRVPNGVLGPRSRLETMQAHPEARIAAAPHQHGSGDKMRCTTPKR
jgi:hypothetical protein